MPRLFSNRAQVVVGVVGFALIVVARLVDHVPNVAPVGAVALLSGTYFSWPWALLVPLSGMLVSDAFIGFASLPITVSVYGSFLIAGLLGRFLLYRRTALRVTCASLLGSLLFYLVTNAAVWRFSPLYPPSLDGLALSYYYAVPFFRMTVLGDLLYVSVLFLAVEYFPSAARWVRPVEQSSYQRRQRPVRPSAL